MRNFKRINLDWMSQWRENKVTKGIMFSMIPFISCEFNSTRLVLIKTPRPEGSRRRSYGRSCLKVFSVRWSYGMVLIHAVNKVPYLFIYLFVYAFI